MWRRLMITSTSTRYYCHNSGKREETERATGEAKRAGGREEGDGTVDAKEGQASWSLIG